jgi:pullulanase/glycogen debranching enzyme
MGNALCDRRLATMKSHGSPETSPRSCRATSGAARWQFSGVPSHGCPDVFGREEREAEQSINFVTCQNGFTLNDLASVNS